MTRVPHAMPEHTCCGMRSVLLAILTAVLFMALITPKAAFAEDATNAAGSTVSSTTYESTVSGADDTNIDVSGDATVALAEGASFGISDFSRMNKGTNKLYNGAYYGYRYPMASSTAFIAVVGNGFTIVYIPESVANSLGIDITDESFQQMFVSTLVSIDSAAANGGQTLEQLGNTYYFTSDTSYVRGDYAYAFGVEVEEDYYYATVTLAGSDDGSGGALYAETGKMTAAADTVVTAKATGFAAFQEFMSTLDWSPLWMSLKTTGVAILVIFILGLLAAWGTVHASDKFKGVFDTIFTIPMVLPPTVCGFLLLLLFGNSTAAGRWFIKHGIDIVFTWPAAVLACIVVGFPLLYRTARGAFESLDPSMLDAARTLGWSEGKIFLRLMMPLAWPTIASGTVLAFARAMGEFGATLFFAGNFAGITQTIPIAIYFDWMAGKTDVAIFWVIVVILISFLVILFINMYSSHTQRYRIPMKSSRRRKNRRNQPTTSSGTTVSQVLSDTEEGAIS